MRWAFPLLLVSTTTGVLTGLGCFTFQYAQGLSYFSNDPNACANCQVMRDYLDSWQKSSHHGRAVCNDCHSPHEPLPKLAGDGDVNKGFEKVCSMHWREGRKLVCHPFSEEEMKARAEAIQERNLKFLDRAEGALIDLIVEIQSAQAKGAPQLSLRPAARTP